MDLKYWVFTDGRGSAYINFNSTLTIKKPTETGQIIHFGTFLPKVAGVKVSYDVGLCQVMYSDHYNITAEYNDVKIEDYYFHNQDWFKHDPEFQVKSQAQQLINCSVEKTGKACLDENQKGEQNWKLDDEQVPLWNVTRSKSKLRLYCPARRIMNTYDYLDVKVGIQLNYQVYGFYFLTERDGKTVLPIGGYTDLNVPEQEKFKNGTLKEPPVPEHFEGLRIKIFERGASTMVSFSVLIVSMTIALAGFFH